MSDLVERFRHFVGQWRKRPYTDEIYSLDMGAETEAILRATDLEAAADRIEKLEAALQYLAETSDDDHVSRKALEALETP